MREFAPGFPDDARLWIHPLDPKLEAAREQELRAALEVFFQGWQSHGQPLAGQAEIVEGRLLLIVAGKTGADEVSGCAGDSLLHGIGELEKRFGLRILRAPPVACRDGAGGIQIMERPEFIRALKGGLFKPESRVFDTTLTRLGDLRAGRFEVPLNNGWHGELYRRHAPG